MTTPPGSSKDSSSPDVGAETLAARRRADAEARRAIEEANRLAREREAVYQARLAQKQALEQAEVEEKQAAARAKAEARAEAAQARAGAKAEAAQEKARARAAEAAARDAALAKKEAERAGRSEDKAKLQALKSRLRGETQAQAKALGAPLAELIAWYLQVFALRPDVVVLRHNSPSPIGLEALLNHGELSAEILAFYHQLGATDFCWAFEKDSPAVGALQVPPASELSFRDGPGESTAKHVALTANRSSAESMQLLLEPLVRRAFTDRDRSADLERLQSSSAHLWSTPSCLVDAVVKKGLSAKQAALLVSWLGEDARLLIHCLETTEGKRRDTLKKNVDVSNGTLDRALLEAMNAGPPLEKSQWQKLLADHQSFLDHDGGGGDFEFQVRDRLPALLYRGPAVPGQALLFCENLSNAKFDGANLAYAGLAGIRGEQASFAKADLSHASLTYAVFNGAKFNAAKLVKCDFSACRLVSANFRGADLTGTNFERADLTGANFAGAVIKDTRFGGALLKDVKY